MKKLLLLLVGCVVAFAANAQLYLVGPGVKTGTNDEIWDPKAPVTVQVQNGWYTFELVATGKEFQMSKSKGSNWNDFNSGLLGINGSWSGNTSDGLQACSLVSTGKDGDNRKFNAPEGFKYVRVSSDFSKMEWSNKAFSSEPVVETFTYAIHGQIFGKSEWSTEDFTKNGDNWEWTGKLNLAGTNFGIKKLENGNQIEWIGGSTTIAETNKEYSFTSGSNSSLTFSVNTADDYTIVYNPTAQTIIFKHNVVNPPVTTFKRFHLIGNFNSWTDTDYTYEFDTEDGVTYTLTLESALEIGNGLKVKEVGVNDWFGLDPKTKFDFGKTIPLNGDGNIKPDKNIPAGAVITFTYDAADHNASTILVETNDVADETPDAIYMHFKYDLSEYGKTGAVPYCQYYNKNNTNEKSAVKVMTLESDRYSIWKAPLSEEEATKYNAVKFWFDKDDGTANYDSTKDSGDWTVAFFDSDNWTKYIYATSSRDHNKVGNYEYAVQTYLSYARFKQLDQLDIDNGGRRNLYLVGWGKTDDTYIQYYDDNDSEVPKNMPKEVTNSLKLDQDGGCFYLTILPDGGSFKISWLSVADAINKLPEGYDKTDSQREWATFDLGLIGVDKDHKYPSNEYKPKYERNDGVNGKVYFVRNRSVRYMNYNQADWVLPTNTDNLPGVGRKRWLVVDTHCAYNADGSIDEANSCKTATITSFDPNPSVEVTVSGVQPRKEPLADDVAKAMHHDCLYGAEANGHIYMKNVNYAVADVKINATHLEDVENFSFSRLYTLYVNNKVVGTHSGTNLENLHIDYFPLSYDVEGNSMSVRAKYTDSNTNLNFHSRTGKGQVKTDVKFKAPQEEILEGQYVFEGYAEDGQEIYGVYVKGLDCQVADNDYNVYSDFRFDRGSYADFVDENHYLYTASKGAFPAWDGWSNGGDWSSKLMADRELAPLFIHNVVRVANLDELKAMDDKEITCTLYAVYPFMYNPNATFTVNAETPASAPALRANEDFTGFKVFNTAVPTSFSFKVSADNAVSGVEGIEADVEAENTEAVYYTVSGVKVVGDPAPGIYVRVQGAKAEKVVLR